MAVAGTDPAVRFSGESVHSLPASSLAKPETGSKNLVAPVLCIPLMLCLLSLGHCLFTEGS